MIPDAESLYAYGGGSGPIHFAGFQCRGDESHLVNCSVDFSGPAVVPCQHFEDAGVRCPSGEFELSLQSLSCRALVVFVQLMIPCSAL